MNIGNLADCIQRQKMSHYHCESRVKRDMPVFLRGGMPGVQCVSLRIDCETHLSRKPKLFIKVMGHSSDYGEQWRGQSRAGLF